MRRLVLLLGISLVLVSCGGAAVSSPGEAAAPPRPTATPAPEPEPEPTPVSTQAPVVGASPLAELIRPAGSLHYDAGAARAEESPLPVSIDIEGIGVVSAPIREVGVERNGEMEIPGAEEVGWYGYGPRPGDEGSAVLAAHVAFDGDDGVFRHLDDVRPGTRFVVDYSDGSRQAFVVTETAQYGKEELPFDRVFARTGEPVVALVTCGGDFNRSLRSYDDNVVAYAVPLT